jgi:subtilisin family serine protease
VHPTEQGAIPVEAGATWKARSAARRANSPASGANLPASGLAGPRLGAPKMEVWALNQGQQPTNGGDQQEAVPEEYETEVPVPEEYETVPERYEPEILLYDPTEQTGRIIVGLGRPGLPEVAAQSLTVLENEGLTLDTNFSGVDIDQADLTRNTGYPDLSLALYVDVEPAQISRVRELVDDPSSPITFATLEAKATAFTEDSPPSWQLNPRMGESEAEASEWRAGFKAGLETAMEQVGATELAWLAEMALNESAFTWGLQVTKAATSALSGRSIKVAILDTGLDMGHPDFQGRSITARSFVPGLDVQDKHGHGTHCAGTACGLRVPHTRAGGAPGSYGCAPNAEIFVGKVLDNNGSGNQGSILAGIQWAIANGCDVISMSLGFNACSITNPSFDEAYEQAGQAALLENCLIVAAAGNASARPRRICAIHPKSPAAAPSILGVGALDESLQPAPFSDGGLHLPHGAVDIAGPGVNVYSSFPRPQLYKRMSGTSMATPHVAGIAALWAEANGRFRGKALWQQLLQSARSMPLSSRDVGKGLVQAP